MNQVINDILIEIAFLQGEPAADMVLKSDLGIDSLRLVELIVKIETRFNIEISDTDLDVESLKTVGDIYKLTDKYLKDK